MADLRARIGIKIVDPTTDANEVGVDASGNLQTILAANTGVDIGDVDVLTLPDVNLAAGTNNIGDVDVLTLPNAEADDDLVAAAQTQQRVLGLLYGFDGTNWERLQTDASGALDVNVTLALPTGTNNIGDVDVLTLPDVNLAAGTNNIGDVDVLSVIPGVGAADLGKTEDIAHTTGDTGVFVLSVRDDSPPTSTAGATGDYAALLTDATGRLYINLEDGGALPAGTNNIGDVDVLTLPDVNLAAGTNNIGDVDVLSGPTGASAFETQGTAADGANPVGNPVLIAGFDGTNVQQLATDSSGNLQVDILTGGGADAPTAPKVDALTSASLAAGSSVSLDGTQVASGLTGKLAGITVSASVPLKVEVRTALNASYTTRIVLFGRSMEPITWVTPHRDYISQIEDATAGFDGFNVNITNMDNTQAADVYATIFWDEQ